MSIFLVYSSNVFKKIVHQNNIEAVPMVLNFQFGWFLYNRVRA